ncbi:30S ribosomal protein S6 [Agromyces sp. SYSU T0242]|uniref:30S ribosomal protein S6 n=1 Tax=Agromyces litoreus TaxID=3158561 RepID=UPI00339861B4
MHQYELMVILDPSIDERTVAPSLDKFLNVIRNDGGTVDTVDIWGKRRLAYEINKKSEGIYAVVNFTAESATTDELDRQLNLSEAIMRTKVLRTEEAVARAEKVRADEAKRAAKKATAAAKKDA